MELEGYLDTIGLEDIRIKGTRVGIEYVLLAYQEGASPEEIVLRYPTLTLEQVHGTITYYLHNRTTMDAYLSRRLEEEEVAWRREEAESREFVQRLRQRLESRGEGGGPLAGERAALSA
jgi:uncharacterized protein (DUF433 family)